MTFSLALRNSREVSAKTRARLQDLAFRAGYRPDPQVSKLMHHLRTRRKARVQANLCAMTHAWKLGRFPAGSFPHRLDASLRSRADALGYTLEFLNLDDYPTARQLQRVLVNRGIEGLLLLPLREPTDLSRRLDWSLFSTVSVTSSLIAPKLHSVTPNHYDNTLKACRELAAAGFRRIGIAMASDWDKRVSHRWSGGIAWQNQFGGTEPVRPLIGDKPGTSLDAGIFARWLRPARWRLQEWEVPPSLLADLLFESATAERCRRARGRAPRCRPSRQRGAPAAAAIRCAATCWRRT